MVVSGAFRSINETGHTGILFVNENEGQRFANICDDVLRQHHIKSKLFQPLRAEKGVGIRVMETVLLVIASIAALAFGVLSAYGACILLFTLVRIHGAQQAAQTPATAASVQAVNA